MKIMTAKILILATMFFLMVSCGETKKPLNTTTTPTEVLTEEAKPINSYEKEWETFKKAVLTKDIKGISAFASSDAVDAEALLEALSGENFLDTLKETSFNDLTVTKSEQGESLEFHAEVTGTDDEGNEVGSGVTIYFSKGKHLELDYFIAAG